MTDLRLVVVGAQGRMGRALITAISEQQGVCVAGAVEREGAECIGMDAGTLAGLQPLDIPVTSDLDAALDAADGVIDFTAPQASLAFARITAAKSKIHIIGYHRFHT